MSVFFPAIPNLENPKGAPARASWQFHAPFRYFLWRWLAFPSFSAPSNIHHGQSQNQL
jgi:hypothetical protein